jgi:hypothetical protein
MSKRGQLIAILVAAGVIAGATNVRAKEAHEVAGVWRLAFLQTEDVATGTRRDVYGANATGHLRVDPDGRFIAQIRSALPIPPRSVWEDVAQNLDPLSRVAGVDYSGKFRIDGNTLFVRVEYATHGIVGTDAFDATWTEQLTRGEERRSYSIEFADSETERLHINTDAMPNPNGSGSMIVGRAVWERVSHVDEWTTE